MPGMPWARQPGSVIYDFPQTSLYFGLRVLRAEVSSGGVLDERRSVEGFGCGDGCWSYATCVQRYSYNLIVVHIVCINITNVINAARVMTVTFDITCIVDVMRVINVTRTRARMSLLPDWFHIVHDQEELLSTWCKIMTYLLPMLDTAGKSPV
jgi:hypothetical protein